MHYTTSQRRVTVSSGSNSPFDSRLPILWRACKLAYNETYDTPFASNNIFQFIDWPSFILLHVSDPHVMGRIQSLSLGIGYQIQLKRVLQLRSDRSTNLIPEDEELLYRKSNLQRMLTALMNLWLISRITLEITRASASSVGNQAYFTEQIQNEKDKVSRMVSFWKPPVSKVIVEEAAAAQDEMRSAVWTEACLAQYTKTRLA